MRSACFFVERLTPGHQSTTASDVGSTAANRKHSDCCSAAGVVGQAVPGMAREDALSPTGLNGDYAWVPLTGRLDDEGKPTDWRSNAYLVGWTGGTVTYFIVNEKGGALAEGHVALAPGQTVQLNKIIEQTPSKFLQNQFVRGLLLAPGDTA